MDAPERRRVLVIDDSDIALAMMREILEGEGFEVRAATTLEGFDSFLKDWVPQVIVTDVNMPGMTGVQLCSALKRHYETAHVPILLCSSLPHSELEELARECESDGFLCKDDVADRLGDEINLLCDTTMW